MQDYFEDETGRERGGRSSASKTAVAAKYLPAFVTLFLWSEFIFGLTDEAPNLVRIAALEP
jgi:hypothetical protein